MFVFQSSTERYQKLASFAEKSAHIACPVAGFESEQQKRWTLGGEDCAVLDWFNRTTDL
jgi:hypothetical protein